MTQAPRITVVMPCFNGANHIENTLAGVFGQSYDHFELIVVDDGSTDNSVELLKRVSAKESRLSVIEQSNHGPGYARNVGIQRAHGEYIAFLDADDRWEPEFLAKMLDALEQNPNADIAYCGWANVFSNGEERSHIPPDYELEDKLEFIVQHCPWPIHAALTRRGALTEAQGFDEALTSCMDYDLWLRLASRRQIVRVPEVMAFYVHHQGDQITNNRARIAMNHWQVQKRFVADNPDLVSRFGNAKIRRLVHGHLLHRGYEAYWKRDLITARKIFRTLMKQRFGSWSDWKYMLPSLAPYGLHKCLLRFQDRNHIDRST